MVGVSQVILVLKNLLANAGDVRNTTLIPGSGRSPGGGPGHLLQYSCLENPMDRGDWLVTAFRVAKSWTQLKRLSSSAAHYVIRGRGKVKVNVSVTHSCPTLCIPMDCSSLGSSVHGIFQASILEWVAISFSRGRGSGGIQKKKKNSLLNIADCAADLKNNVVH